MTPGQYHPGIAAAEVEAVLTAAFSEGAQRSVITGSAGRLAQRWHLAAKAEGLWERFDCLGRGETMVETIDAGPSLCGAAFTVVNSGAIPGCIGSGARRCATGNGLPEVRGGVHFRVPFFG